MTPSLSKAVVILAAWTTSVISSNIVKVWRAPLPYCGYAMQTNYLEIATNTTKHVTTGWLSDCTNRWATYCYSKNGERLLLRIETNDVPDSWQGWEGLGDSGRELVTTEKIGCTCTTNILDQDRVVP